MSKYMRPTINDSSDEDDDDDGDFVERNQGRGGTGGAAAAATSANLSSDDDEDNEEEDNEEEDNNNNSNHNNKRKHAPVTTGKSKAPPSAAAGKQKKKKAKTSEGARPSSFFDDEAYDDDDEDEEDLEGEQGMDEAALEIIRQQDRRRKNAGLSFLEAAANERTIAHNIEQRHRAQAAQSRAAVAAIRAPPLKQRGAHNAAGSSSTAGAASSLSHQQRQRQRDTTTLTTTTANDDDDVVDPTTYASAAVAQQSLVPSIKDPNLWIVNCLTGKEAELVYQIMNKCIAQARAGRPCGITAVIAAQTKGKIYIESYNEPAVKQVMTGVRGLMAYSAKLVPIADMTTVMNVVTKKKPVKKGDWVRLVRGHYKGDLARVKEIKENGLKCIVQAIPRLDLSLSDLSPDQARARRKTVRPAQKFFSTTELTNAGRGQAVLRQRFPGLDIFCDYFEGNYYLDGYLLKEMTVGNMVKICTEEDPPTLDELQKFQRRKTDGSSSTNADGTTSGAADEEDEASKAATSLLEELSALQGTNAQRGGSGSAAESGLGVGDMVEVVEGDLIGVIGRVVSLDGNTVKVHSDRLASHVEFLVTQVTKYIAVGTHVKVTSGRYANETGVVVAIDTSNGDTTAVLLTDITNHEISVRTSQLRESADIASGGDRLQGYELYDLVGLSGGGSANENGVIVRVGREDFTVINNHGRTREVRPEELRGKFNRFSNKAVAMDARGNQIRTGDTVSVTEGTFKGKTATVKRIHRSQLFLHSQTRTENAGIFCVRSRTCLLTGSRGAGTAGGNAVGGDNAMSPFGTPQSSHAGGGGGGPGGRNRADDGLTGKTVRIQAGQWKGYIGTVSDSTATHVQVELHSRLKKVMVVRERVAVVGDKYGATHHNPNEVTIPGSIHTNAAMVPGGGMATPMHALGGATPAVHGFGGATPLHGAEEPDEVWRPGGAIDQDGTGSSATGNNNNTTSNSNNNSAASGWEAAAARDGDDDEDEDTETAWGASTGGSGNDGGDGGTSAWDKAAATKPEPKPESKTEPHIKNDAYAKKQDGGGGDDPQHAAAGLSSVGDTPVWFMDRVCVALKDGSGATATIQSVDTTQQTAVLQMHDGDAGAAAGNTTTTRKVHLREVEMVIPKEHDTVLVTDGNDLGLEGSLVCVDGSDAIVKNASDEYKIIDFTLLVKIDRANDENA